MLDPGDIFVGGEMESTPSAKFLHTLMLAESRVGGKSSLF